MAITVGHISLPGVSSTYFSLHLLGLRGDLGLLGVHLALLLGSTRLLGLCSGSPRFRLLGVCRDRFSFGFLGVRALTRHVFFHRRFLTFVSFAFGTRSLGFFLHGRLSLRLTGDTLVLGRLGRRLRFLFRLWSRFLLLSGNLSQRRLLGRLTRFGFHFGLLVNFGRFLRGIRLLGSLGGLERFFLLPG